MTAVTKDPNARLDYGINWADTTVGSWLIGGDTITASTWATYEADGVTPSTDLDVDTHSNTTTTTTVWLTGGIANKTYKATNHITTAQGRQDDRSITVKCKER